MKAPTWRVWLTALLFVLWTALAFRFAFVKSDMVTAVLCLVMGAVNAKFLYDLTYGWRAQADTVQMQEASPQESNTEEANTDKGGRDGSA